MLTESALPTLKDIRDQEYINKLGIHQSREDLALNARRDAAELRAEGKGDLADVWEAVAERYLYEEVI